MIEPWTTDHADLLFSRWIRQRDGMCMHPKCKRKDDRDVNQMQNSHFFGRGEWATRFDPDNCDTAHKGCHMWQWENKKNTDYKYFKQDQLGMKRYNKMEKKVQDSKKMGAYTGHTDQIIACMKFLKKVGFVDENYKQINH